MAWVGKCCQASTGISSPLSPCSFHAAVFKDADDEYGSLTAVKRRLEEWKARQVGGTAASQKANQPAVPKHADSHGLAARSPSHWRGQSSLVLQKDPLATQYAHTADSHAPACIRVLPLLWLALCLHAALAHLTVVHCWEAVSPCSHTLCPRACPPPAYMQPGAYRDAYVSLSAPALFAPFVRMELLKWRPLHGGEAGV